MKATLSAETNGRLGQIAAQLANPVAFYKDVGRRFTNELRKHFSEKEMADLTLAVATINAWNRLAIAARTVPGTYEPAKVRVKQSA